jgi:RNA polymerase sigma-70 factor (ECF subfamily)
MHTTSFSLLQRLRQPGEQDSWARFVKLYTPLLFYWGRRAGLRPDDAADLVQEVLTVLVQKLPEFSYDGDKSFRNWLRTITLNKWRDYCRRRALQPRPLDVADLSGLAEPAQDGAFAETEYRQQLVARALELLRAEFQPTTWQAAYALLSAGQPAADVARQLGISTNAVYLAKSRVLRRLREELSGLLD